MRKYQYTLHGDPKASKTQLPEDAVVLEENRNWVIVGTDMEWDAMRDHFRGVALVAINRQEKPWPKEDDDAGEAK